MCEENSQERINVIEFLNWGSLLRYVPRAITGRNLSKVTFGASGFYLTTSLYLTWWKKGWATYNFGKKDETSVLSFFCQTLTFKLFQIFCTTCDK